MPERKFDFLEDIFQRQEKLQIDKMGGSPRQMARGERIQFVKDMAYALEDEIHEATAEIGWKPWAASDHFNTEQYNKELIDALHFFVNLMLAGDMTPAMVWRMYVKKNELNRRRQEEGYDGVSTKCSHCKRALDDIGTGFLVSIDNPDLRFCGQKCSTLYAEQRRI